MRKSSTLITLSILSPALLVGCGNRNDCDPRYERCETRYTSGGGVYYVRSGNISSGSYSSGTTTTRGTSTSVGSGSSRGGFGGFFGSFGG